MPGVLLVEAMSQCGGLLVLNQIEDPERWSTYFLKIDGVKFRQKVVPGDTVLFRVELLGPVRHGISSMKGYMFVGDHVVAEASFTAQIVKNKYRYGLMWEAYRRNADALPPSRSQLFFHLRNHLAIND